jgi:adenine-specific DNA-methyltransferase
MPRKKHKRVKPLSRRNTEKLRDNELFRKNIKLIDSLGKAKESALLIFNLFCEKRQLTSSEIVKVTGLTKVTAINILGKFVEFGIIQDTTPDKERYKVYSFGGMEELPKNGYGLYFKGRWFAEQLAESKTDTKMVLEKFENGENLFLIGDNLESMKHLLKGNSGFRHILFQGKTKNKSYMFKVTDDYKEQIKIAYIDPPYNMSPDGAQYKDKMDGHAVWLNFMLPRLKLVQKLLREDGLVFISINDYEQAQLKILCDEIFGATNFINQIVIENEDDPGLKAGHKNKMFVGSKEYLLVYAKNKKLCKNMQPLYDKANQPIIRNFQHIMINNRLMPLKDFLLKFDGVKKLFGKDKINTSDITELMSSNDYFRNEIYHRLSDLIVYENRLSKPVPKEIMAKYKDGDIFQHEGKNVIRKSETKARYIETLSNKLHEFSDGLYYGFLRGDLWKGFASDYSNAYLEGGVSYNSGKKPLRLMRDILKWANDKHALVLEVFGGVGSMSHAVLQQNKEDGGTRNFIVMQLEETPQDQIKIGNEVFCSIDQATKKRLDNAVEETIKDLTDSLDIDESKFRILRVKEA